MKMFYIWITIRCYFAYLSIDILICVLHLIFFEILVSEIIYFIHQIVVIGQIHGIRFSLRNNLFALARRITVIVL